MKKAPITVEDLAPIDQQTLAAILVEFALHIGAIDETDATPIGSTRFYGRNGTASENKTLRGLFNRIVSYGLPKETVNRLVIAAIRKQLAE